MYSLRSRSSAKLDRRRPQQDSFSSKSEDLIEQIDRQIKNDPKNSLRHDLRPNNEYQHHLLVIENKVLRKINLSNKNRTRRVPAARDIAEFESVSEKSASPPASPNYKLFDMDDTVSSLSSHDFTADVVDFDEISGNVTYSEIDLDSNPPSSSDASLLPQLTPKSTLKASPKKTTPMNDLRQYYQSSSFPFQLDHSHNAPALHWTTPPSTLSVSFLLPMLLSGLNDSVHPFHILSILGAKELLSSQPQVILITLPNSIQPIINHLSSPSSSPACHFKCFHLLRHIISLDPCVAISLAGSRQLSVMLRACNNYLSNELSILVCHTGLANSANRTHVSVSEIARELVRSLVVYGGRSILDDMRSSCPLGLSMLDDDKHLNDDKSCEKKQKKMMAADKPAISKKSSTLKRLNRSLFKER